MATHSLPGESHGQRHLVGYSPWGRKSRTRLSNLGRMEDTAGTALSAVWRNIQDAQLFRVSTISTLTLQLRKLRLREENVTDLQVPELRSEHRTCASKKKETTRTHNLILINCRRYGTCSIRNMKQERSINLAVKRYFSDARRAKHECSRSDAKISLAVHFINGLEETE